MNVTLKKVSCPVLFASGVKGDTNVVNPLYAKEPARKCVKLLKTQNLVSFARVVNNVVSPKIVVPWRVKPVPPLVLRPSKGLALNVRLDINVVMGPCAKSDVIRSARMELKNFPTSFVRVDKNVASRKNVLLNPTRSVSLVIVQALLLKSRFFVALMEKAVVHCLPVQKIVLMNANMGRLLFPICSVRMARSVAAH